jgi:hypothetical protein
MARAARPLHRWNVRSVALGPAALGVALALAGCGGDAASRPEAQRGAAGAAGGAPGESDESPPPPPPEPDPAGQAPVASGVPAACPQPFPRTPERVPRPETDDPKAYAQIVIMDLLAEHCSNCHARPDDRAPAGAAQFGNDPRQLAALGLIVPLHSDRSRVLQVMTDGSMPPPCVQPRPLEAEITLLGQYIDNPRFWPDATPAGPGDAGPAPAEVDAAADGGL